ncbi:TolC family protein [Flammeovirgaceae bacterium SG7u.111]|nr:TolC family protein [Flammeovirgaceae bacterium SG7u.132]WPO33198.1 TolC family protein [Flammeovirgaceae bacterium SG7u.111]
MISLKKTFLLFSFALLCYASHAQEKWDLQKCIDYAISNNLDLRLSELSIERNEATLQQSKHARYPDLNGFANQNYNWGRSFDVYTNDAVTARVRSNNFGLNSSVTLFNGFSIANTIKRDEMTLKASKADLKDSEYNLIMNIATFYLQIIFNLENLDIAQRQLENSNEQITRTEKLVNAGVLPESNLLDLLSQRATDDLQVVNAENTLALSILNLKQLLQLPASEEFEIEIPELPDPEEAPIIMESEDIFKISESILPVVESADLNIEASELSIEIAKSNYYPTLTLSGGINTFYSSAQQFRQQVIPGSFTESSLGYFYNDNGTTSPVYTVQPQFERIPFGFQDQLSESLRQSLGFTLRIPIYNKNQIKTGVSIAQINREQARVSAQRVRNQLRQDIETARQNVLAASKTYNSNSKRVEALRETYRVTNQRFSVGAVNSTELTIARNNLVNAESDMLRSKYDFIFRSKLLDFLMGKPITFDGN